MPTLFELNGDLEALDDLLDEMLEVEDADGATLEQWQAQIEGAFNDKIQRIAHVVKAIGERGKARKRNAASLALLAKQDAAKVSRLKAYALEAMRRADVKRIDTETGAVTRCENGGKLPLIVDDAKIPEMLPTELQKITVELDRAALRHRIEVGESYEFARIAREEERGEYLRIK